MRGCVILFRKVQEMSDKPEERLKELYIRKNLTLATAESCTGGLLAGRITDVAGSSEYYIGGTVSYAYAAKETQLGVKHETLLEHGAVSLETVREMARGIRERLGVDVAVSISGVAGPGGGTPQKPVGTVCLGLSDATGERAERFQWTEDRAENRRLAVEKALEWLLEWGEQAEPRPPRPSPYS